MIYRCIEYSDIRGQYAHTNNGNIFKVIWSDLPINTPDKFDYQDCLFCRGRDCMDKMDDICAYVMAFWLFVIVFPVFCVGKLLQILFPYIIVGFLIYWRKWEEIHLFQLMMLYIYILLQIMTFIFGAMVGKTQYIIWHIECGVSSVDLRSAKDTDHIRNINEWYFEKTSLPIIEKYLC